MMETLLCGHTWGMHADSLTNAHTIGSGTDMLVYNYLRDTTLLRPPRRINFIQIAIFLPMTNIP
jgi:hypothetical protein